MIEPQIFVRGVFGCSKCGFRLTKSNLNARDGSVTVNDECEDDCPNCAIPMTRVTWEEDAHDAYKTAESQMNRALKAERERDALADALRNLERANHDLAATRSQGTYLSMIDNDKATVALEALDEARRDARSRLALLARPVIFGIDYGRDVSAPE